MRMTFKSFDSKMASRDKLFKAAVEFANKLDRKDLITVTHSEDRDNIVITIWYWTDEPDKGAAIKAKRTQDVVKLQGTPARPGPGDIEATPVRDPGETQRPVFGQGTLRSGPPPEASSGSSEQGAP